MLEKRLLLRAAVRKEMALEDNDMLVMSLSSINAGKGQLILLESARLMIDQYPLQIDSKVKKSSDIRQDQSTLAVKHHLRGKFSSVNTTKAVGVKNSHRRKIFDGKGTEEQDLKILIGSVGSKSNEIPYVKEILNFLSHHAKLSESVLWISYNYTDCLSIFSSRCLCHELPGTRRNIWESDC
ncbi:hypothetical protein F3Y22_tig00116997pilonHSYRG00695 [Hibiscus syriacus]|uniref:Uncharacterized protein n=1 Tax=Hibiscus syriacus TaxID=106335 RepID=A0A6A2WGL4_HIBSY|nr:hypothetical protein F3Y22_tig00116997pilonHSYRG00695 [Hibiscus syriacus]